MGYPFSPALGRGSNKYYFWSTTDGRFVAVLPAGDWVFWGVFSREGTNKHKKIGEEGASSFFPYTGLGSVTGVLGFPR